MLFCDVIAVGFHDSGSLADEGDITGSETVQRGLATQQSRSARISNSRLTILVQPCARTRYKLNTAQRVLQGLADGSTIDVVYLQCASRSSFLHGALSALCTSLMKYFLGALFVLFDHWGCVYTMPPHTSHASRPSHNERVLRCLVTCGSS